MESAVQNKSEAAVPVVKEQEIEHRQWDDKDWQQHDTAAEEKKDSKPEIINIEHIDLEFSSSHAVQLDDVPFEFDYSRKDKNGGEY